MYQDWGGFTEAEIKSIINAKKFNLVCDPKINKPGVGVAKRLNRDTQRRFPKKNVTRERMLNGDRKPSSNIPTHGIPKDARLFIPQIPEEEEEEEEEKSLAEGEKEESTGPVLKSQSIEISASKLMENHSDCASGEKLHARTLLFQDSPDIDALTKFQEKQKFMEEHNRQQKELLQKALADRTKKTKEEARRLHQIEEELKKMDAMLSNDVSIIRNQIELASHDFMEAQKRYDKAEREFLEAKLCLFNYKEKKEMLTSHLCTIIEQNEIRKAKKLSDLMEKLQIGGELASQVCSSGEPKKESSPA